VSESQEVSQFDPNTTAGTFIVALVLCLVCAFVVSTAAVGLRPLQETNAKNKMMRNVLIAAGLWDSTKHTDRDIPELFKNIETTFWNLPAREGDPGSPNTELDDAAYERLVSTPAGIREIDPAKDVAGIKRRETVARIYLLKDESGKIEKIILPIAGKGLWSTLYGFLAVDPTTTQSRGITFYKHAETPGLGGEVDNPRWKARWSNPEEPIELRTVGGEPLLDVTKPGGAQNPNQIDGLSGATITSNGVENTIRYWLGSDAFGPYLDQMAAANAAGSSSTQTTAVTP
jgi:Na+-transporting NADH:ubiquinone oxidoreductase subunit C